MPVGLLDRNSANRAAIRFIAALLLLGGVAGLVLVLMLEAGTEGRSHPIFLVCGLVLFMACVWVGFGLWRNEERYKLWAMLLLFLQVPNIEVQQFAYQFYAGSGLFLSFQSGSSSRLGFDFEIASALKCQIPSGADELVLGINLLALLAALYLMKKPRLKIELTETLKAE
jgi:hypothetical protein